MATPSTLPEPTVEVWLDQRTVIRVDRRGLILGTGRSGRLGCRIPLLDRRLRARVAAAFTCDCDHLRARIEHAHGELHRCNLALEAMQADRQRLQIELRIARAAADPR